MIFKMKVALILSTVGKCIFDVEKQSWNVCEVFCMLHIYLLQQNTYKGNNMRKIFLMMFFIKKKH